MNFDDLKCSRMKGFSYLFLRLSSPWLKKILNFDDLKCSRMKDFSYLSSEYFHHGWRKFWILMIWNAPEWRISATIFFSEYSIFTMELFVEREVQFLTFPDQRGPFPDFSWLFLTFPDPAQKTPIFSWFIIPYDPCTEYFCYSFI